jgi:TolA-binding protein
MVKKIIFTSLALFGLLFSDMQKVCFADASGQGITAIAPDPAGLVAHYEFEGDAADTSVFQPSADGTLVGNPTFAPGVFGRAIGLDGDGDYVDCGNESFVDINDQLTVTSWIKVSEFDKKYQTIIAKGDNSWRLARVGDSNNVEFACNGTAATRWTGKGEVPWAVLGTTGVNDGKWHHIAGVFDGTRLQLYIDGVLEAAKSAANSINISEYNVCIGANAQIPGREWNGLIDDVRIYNYALSQAEIVSVMGESEIDVPSSLPATLYDIAKRYDKFKKFEEAKGVCQLILERYPDSSAAHGAQLYLSGQNIMSLIESKKFIEAQEELNALIADFNDHPDFAEALCSIARSYEWPRKFEQAESLYGRAAGLDPNNPYVVEAQFNAPKLHIFSLIKSENYTEAEAAIDELTADFAKHPALPGVVYWFGKEFEAAKRYERAKGIYQQVAQRYPESSHASKALLAASKMDVLSLIESGDDTAAHAALDKLIADFKDHPDLPEAVFVIGEQYYNKGFRYEKEGLNTEAKESFTKAIIVWEIIITELPPNAVYPAQAYFVSAECYRRLHEYENAIEYYSIVVDNWPDCKYSWHAQFIVARTYKHLKRTGVMPESEADAMIKAAYERILQHYPNSPAAYDARKWLNSHQESNQGEQK